MCLLHAKRRAPFFPTDRVLSQNEIVQLITNFAQLGVHKVRITGGEPILRTDVVDIVRRIKKIDGIEDVSITTNGLFLAKKAKDLKEAGLDRLNISLDTFKPEVYKEITRGGNINQVLDGIATASALHFKKIKLNIVLIRGKTMMSCLTSLTTLRTTMSTSALLNLCQLVIP